MTLIAFHHKRNKGFIGDKFEKSEAILDDGFYPSPTDRGMCLSRYLNIDKIMRVKEPYSSMFQSKITKPTEKIEGNSARSRMTLVFLPEDSSSRSRAFKQTFPISYPSTNNLELQLHDSEELANFFTLNHSCSFR